MVFEFFLTTAEYAEETPFAQSGDDDWAKTYLSKTFSYLLRTWLPLRLCASHLFPDSVDRTERLYHPITKGANLKRLTT